MVGHRRDAGGHVPELLAEPDRLVARAGDPCRRARRSGRRASSANCRRRSSTSASVRTATDLVERSDGLGGREAEKQRDPDDPATRTASRPPGTAPAARARSARVAPGAPASASAASGTRPRSAESAAQRCQEDERARALSSPCPGIPPPAPRRPFDGPADAASAPRRVPFATSCRSSSSRLNFASSFAGSSRTAVWKSATLWSTGAGAVGPDRPRVGEREDAEQVVGLASGDRRSPAPGELGQLRLELAARRATPTARCRSPARGLHRGELLRRAAEARARRRGRAALAPESNGSTRRGVPGRARRARTRTARSPFRTASRQSEHVRREERQDDGRRRAARPPPRTARHGSAAAQRRAPSPDPSAAAPSRGRAPRAGMRSRRSLRAVPSEPHRPGSTWPAAAGAPAAGAGAGVIAASAMRAKNAASSGAAFSATTRSGVRLRPYSVVAPGSAAGRPRVVGQVADQDDPRASRGGSRAGSGAPGRARPRSACRC